MANGRADLANELREIAIHGARGKGARSVMTVPKTSVMKENQNSITRQGRAVVTSAG